MTSRDGRTVEITFVLDPGTRVARTNAKSVAYLSNRDIASADLIVGRGNIILKDKRGGRIGHRAGNGDYQLYGSAQ